MTDSELLAIVEAEERSALGWGDGELNHEREQALRYYNQEPFGNEVEGRSQIVTSEVSDTVEWIMPSLLKIFTASDKAVEFEPERPEDEESAKQATDACNYVFYRQNNGFMVLHTFFKDALIQKNGYAKVYFDAQKTTKKSKYQGLTEDQLALLLRDDKYEVIGRRSYPDPMAEQMMAQQMAMQPQQAMPQMPMLYDVEVQYEEEAGKTCVDPIPPEEMLIHKDTRNVDLSDALFVAHRCKKTVSELRAMGYDMEDIPSDEANFAEFGPEAQARRRYDEEWSDPDKLDPSRRWVWVTEAYIRVDYDDDGIAELRHVKKAAKKILENEECDALPIAAITPIMMSHRHFGKSVAEAVMDLQLQKSMLTRIVLDSGSFSNMPRMAVLSTPEGAPQANLDDLLTVRPGGVVREYVPDAIRPLVVPFLGQAGLSILEYLDAVKEKRTGVTAYNQGVDANSLNKTATGISAILGQAQQRIELIARVFAETGVKALFKLILHCLVEYGQGRKIAVRLRNQWHEFDPSNWSSQMDMISNVGLGTGNKDQQLVHLQAMAMAQAEVVKMGGMGLIVTPKNIYNVQSKIAENAGFKAVEEFWTDPGDRMPEPQPDPKVELEKQKAEIEKEKAGMDMQAKERQMQLDQRKADQEFQHKERMAQLEFMIKQQEMAIEQQKMGMEMEFERLRHQLGIENEQQSFALKQDQMQNEASIRQVQMQKDADLMLETKKKSADQDLEIQKKKAAAKPKGRDE